MATEDERPTLKLSVHMMTDVGVVRDHNEDAAFIDGAHQFFVVADGMGGHAAGEVASGMAVEEVKASLEASREEIERFARTPSDEGRKGLVALLEQSVRTAHEAVYDRGAKETDKQGMGTTLDVVLLAGPEAFVAHVGDSRTYLIRNGKAAQITTDHTVAEVLVIEGKLSLEEAQISPLRTILVNAIGVAPDVGVEMAHIKLKTGDRLLLCSDGLHDYFPAEQELASYLSDRDPESALKEMVSLAKSRGGHDNITGVVLQVLEAPEEDGEDDLPSDPFADTTSVQFGRDTPVADTGEGVPHEISRDDTAPVARIDDLAEENEKPARRDPDQETVETPAAGEEAAEASEDDEEPGEADEEPEAKAEPRAPAGKKKADNPEDLKSTVRLKPLSAAEMKAVTEDDGDDKKKKTKRKKGRWGR